jgi:nucleoside phosphorylase
MQRLLRVRDDKVLPMTNSSVYEQAGSRLSRLALSVERENYGFGEYIEKQRSAANLVSARVLILVATELERDAVMRSVEGKMGPQTFTRNYTPFHTVFHLGVIGGAEVLLAQSEMGTEGPSAMTLTAMDIVDVYHPDYLILTGIAFGLQEAKQSLGDILVSTHLRLWDPKKVTDQKGANSWILRGDRTSASVTLLDRFRSASVGWQTPRVGFGLILSANTLVNARVLRRRLLKLEPDALGGEMEGAGVYCVGAKRKLDWIVVKAIADWGYQKDDGGQVLAASNAAEYVVHTLSLGGLARVPRG